MSEINYDQGTLDDELSGQKAEEFMKSGEFNISEEPPWLNFARTCLNLKCEGPVEFVNTMLKSCNLPENINKVIPISFASYGRPCDLIPGGILVFDGHVGIIEKVSGDDIKIISYHNNKICITNASDHGKIITCRRPENFAL